MKVDNRRTQQQEEQGYWDPVRETMDPTERDARSLGRMQEQLRYCYEKVPFYRRQWDKHDFEPSQVHSWEDFTQRVPIVTKRMLVEDQVENPPYGSYLGVDPSEVFRIHGSSGTSGTPTIYGVGAADWERAAETFAMTQWTMGVRPGKVVQFAFPFGLFFAGWGTLYGAEKVGASVLPLGLADTSKHVEMIYRLRSEVIEATPSYLFYMAEVARELGYDPEHSPLKRAIVGGEPGGSVGATRARLLETWGFESVCDSGSTSEMFPFCTNTECTEMTGPHLYNDEVWTEVVDPDNLNQPLPEGERGALVYSHLWRNSQPMVRFAPNDAAIMSSDPCSCGRTYPRLPYGVIGRLDDMLVVRGANVYPSAIEQALREIDGLGLEFRILVDRNSELDQMTVQCEVEDVNAAPSGSSRREQLSEKANQIVRHHCQIRVPVELVDTGTLERTTLKAKRVIDTR